MGILEDIKQMEQTGMKDNEIIAKLQEQGVPYRDISEAMAQSRIKAAVEGQYAEQSQQDATAANNAFIDQTTAPQAPQGMQPSMLQSQQEDYFPSYEGTAQPQAGGYDYGQQQQQGYEYTSAALSSDTITEISEQIVSEKMADVRKKMERMIAFKTELEAKTESLEDRLKRIEKIIDTLQASVLRKVGDYVTNVEDIKHELIEAQKTFAKALGSKHHDKDHKK